MAGRAELLEAVSTRYGGATRLERSRILDEFAAVTGYHRKHAIRLLSGWGGREKDSRLENDPAPVESCRCTYGPEVRDGHRQLGGWPACEMELSRVGGRDDDLYLPELRRLPLPG